MNLLVAILFADSESELIIAYSSLECALSPATPRESKHAIPYAVTSDASEPPFLLNTWADNIQIATGERPTAVLMNSETMKLVTKNSAVKNAIYVFANGTVTPNVNTARRYVATETGLDIYLYDKGYTDEATGNFVKFVADDVVVVFDPANVGKGVFGTTPEESDLMAGSCAEVEIVDTGVAITTTKETDPVNVKTKASMIYLPVLTNADGLVIADVSAQ